jgi:hypothetical protein
MTTIFMVYPPSSKPQVQCLVQFVKRCQYAAHLGEHALRRLEMVEREAADGDIEATIRERQAFRIAGPEADIGKATRLAGTLRDLERGVGQIQADHLAAARRPRHRDVSGAGCDSSARSSESGLMAVTNRLRRSSLVITGAAA